MNTQDVVRDINRKIKADLLSHDAPNDAPTLDDALCAIIFVAILILACLL